MSSQATQSYPAAQIDPLVGELLELLEDTVKVAQDAQDEADRLRKAADTAVAAAGEKVVLEKVASLDAGLVKETVQALVDAGFAEAGDMEKLASDLQSNPSFALQIATRLANVAASAPIEGSGIEKISAAKTMTSDPDGWGKVIVEGAA